MTGLRLPQAEASSWTEKLEPEFKARGVWLEARQTPFSGPGLPGLGGMRKCAHSIAGSQDVGGTGHFVSYES